MTSTSSDLTAALTRQPDLMLGRLTSGELNVSLDDSRRYQTIDGFGAAFTDSATALLGGLPPVARYRALGYLFDRRSGIGLSLMREPMGASDYSASPAASPQAWSYDDNGGVADPALAHFSIGHDMVYTIPAHQTSRADQPGPQAVRQHVEPARVDEDQQLDDPGGR